MMEINEQRLVNTFLDLVKIDSPTGHEEEIVKFVCKKLSDLKLSYEIDTFGNIICKTLGEGTPFLLSAHLDTVEPGRNVVPIIENGIIKSSGNTVLGADNKAGVAIILEALNVLFDNNELDSHAIEVVFTISEEVANLGAVNLDYSKIKSKNAFTFDSGSLVGAITMASPFYNRFDIKLIGKSAHAAHPENGINAINILNEALNNFKFGRIDEDTVCNLGVIHGGEVRNTLIGEILISGDIRSFIESKLEETTTNMREAFKNASTKLNGKVEIVIVKENSGFVLNENDKLVQFGIKAIKNLGLDPLLKTSTGCYDANIFFEHNIETLNFGNGSKNNHGLDESITTSDLVNTCKIACNLISLMKLQPMK